jgi:hypothetical protein
MAERYYGKYRGTVVNCIDPESIGRIQAIVPGVPGLEIAPTSWALPVMPFAGKGRGVFVVPEPGAGVWIEFEQGDPRRPIWSGGFWGTVAEVPADALLGIPVLPSIVLQTSPLNTIAISEVPGPTGGIMLRSGTASISVSATGIIIQNGAGASIQLTGPSVIVNNGAMTVI